MSINKKPKKKLQCQGKRKQVHFGRPNLGDRGPSLGAEEALGEPSTEASAKAEPQV